MVVRAAIDQLAAAMPAGLRSTVILAFWAHLRIGEIVGLRRSDIDLEKATLRVERQAVEVRGQGSVITEPKMGSRRVVHLPTPALTAVMAHVDGCGATLLPNAPLFRRPDGQPLRVTHLEWYWRRARDQVGLPHAHFHDLRHAGLTLSAQVGATLAEVMRRAGHSSSAAAMRYQHAAERRDAEIARRLSEAAENLR